MLGHDVHGIASGRRDEYGPRGGVAPAARRVRRPVRRACALRPGGGVPRGMTGDAATLVQAVAALPDAATWSATGVGRTDIRSSRSELRSPLIRRRRREDRPG